MEAMARDLREMQRMTLAPEHVEALRSTGETRTYAQGTFLVHAGDRVERFIYIEDGEAEAIDPYTRERHLPETLGSKQFLGEVSFLDGGNWVMPMRAVRDTRVIEVDRARMLTLMERIPEMSDLIITVLAARRRSHVEAQDGAIVLLGEDADRSVQRIAEFAARNRIPYTSLPLGSTRCAAVARSCSLDPGRPAVVLNGRVVLDPTPETVARLMGFNRDLEDHRDFDLLIVGGGPAGVAAGVYAGAEGLRALVVEDTAIGGQAGTSSRIENYLGFPTGISGADLVWRGEIQAMKFRTRFAMPRRVTGLDPLPAHGFCAHLDDGHTVRARAVVVATGVQYRRLPLERIRDFEGAGIYYAATDMEARHCRQTVAVIVGGGNSAGQAAMFLCRSAKAVRVIVRGGSLAASMSPYLSDRLEADPSISLEFNSELVGLIGNERLEAVIIRDNETGAETTVETQALFIMIGAAPKTDWLQDLVGLDAKGFVRTGPDAGAGSSFGTSCSGIFAVGDIRAGAVKRVASAVGEGSVVISEVWRFLNP